MLLFDTKVSISYYASGTRNNLGEPSRTLTVREANVPASLQNKSPKIMFDFPAYIQITGKSGQANIILKVLWVGRNKTIEENDIITDSNGATYTVAEVVSHRTHKAALLQREV